MSFFPPSWLLYGKYFFQLLARLQTRDNHLDALLWCLYVFSQARSPSDGDLEWLSHQVERWRILGRCLRFRDETLTVIDQRYRNTFEKGYQMLRQWKEMGGLDATYVVLHDALCHPLVNRRGLVENFCRQPHEWLLLCWLIDSFYFYFYWLFHCQMNMYPQYGYTITKW